MPRRRPEPDALSAYDRARAALSANLLDLEARLLCPICGVDMMIDMCACFAAGEARERAKQGKKPHAYHRHDQSARKAG